MRKFLLRMLAVTTAAICLLACSPKPMTLDEATVWVAAYTPEQIDMGSLIRIEPTDSLLAKLDTLRSLENVFKFSPSIDGEAVFTNGGQYIDFRPNFGALEQGKEYSCRMDMSVLTGIDSLKDFTFNFYVDRRETKFDNVKISIDPANVEQVIVEGSIKFSFYPSDISIDNSLLSCNIKGAKAQLHSTDDELEYTFSISGVRRKEDDSILEIEYTPLAEFAKATTTILIPGLAEFKLLSAERHEAVQPYMELEFSAPLDASQELEGLISIDRIDNLRIERKGTNVKVFYPNNGITDMVLRISDLLRSGDGRTLSVDIEQHIEQEVLPPAIEIPISGTILPDNRNLTLPFRAVNLAAVDVEVVKIYSDNVLIFLQDNEMKETSSLRRVGRLIYKQTVRLDKDKSLNLHQWQNFSVDLKNLFRQERGAIYNIRLSFCKAYSLYDKAQASQFEIKSGVTDEDKAIWDETYSYIGRRASDYNWWDYEWSESDDPSKESYYMSTARMPEYNLAASDLGLIVKRADTEQLWCAVSDIVTTAPLSGIRVVAYNYQMREIGSAYTNEQGFADFRTDGNPFVITASNGISTTFLKTNGASELSTSRFNVGGKKIPQDVKGFVYGERGVWRPGDNIFLTMIVEDKQHALPTNHPVTMELYTPSEQLYDRQTLTKSIDGIYTFQTKTADDAPTGRWDARFKVGGQTFHHPVRIETIKPNRLKINISSPELLCGEVDTKIGIEAHWLTGPVADGLQAKMEMSIFKNPDPFENYGDYLFANPLSAFSHAKHDVLSGKLDSLGRISKKILLPTTEDVPGMLQANLIARVAETGGDESITSHSVRYSPYTAYVGIKLDNREFETDCNLRFPVIVLNPDGKTLDSRELEYKIYRLDWSWWHEGSASELSRYVQSKSAEIVANGKLKTTAGKAEIPFRVDYPSWGKYLVFVRDIKSGHATGGEIYIDWPDWRGHSGKNDPTAATMLSFALDKKNYEVGDVATIYLPKSAGGRVLLSVENGSRVLSRRWVQMSAEKETAYKLSITKDMAPNFYVHATLLQPHAQTVNDLPIRMYGVEGAEVIDRYTVLHPEIKVADEILPQQEFSVKIREKDNKAMSYTLAIVDEGLLDITAFKTPEPWRAMNHREALGVKTWDMYDDVIGAYAGKFTSILSIGGDEAIRKAAGKEKRFNPVVKFLGPFTLNGGTNTHKITLPMYTGSVRVMVVAAHKGCYGSADKTVTVRSPLMLLSTLPRMLVCGDRVKVPVNVFSTEEGTRNVAINIKVEGPATIIGSSEKTLVFVKPDEQITEFELLCDKQKSGKAKVIISAQGDEQSVNETIYIDIRNPQPVLTTLEARNIGTGKSEIFEWKGATEGEVRMEIATMPTINFSGAFSFVENYRHLCTEQLSSQAMYMLYARRFLNEIEQNRAETDLPKILKTILSRQLPNGGFAYWSGYSDAHEWATSMAGEVMTEARRQGFVIDQTAYDHWKEYQKNVARSYRHSTTYAADLVQAYRLYTLALAGEIPSAAMNKLRESKNMSYQALLRLAAAYTISGRGDVADKLLEKADATSKINGSYATFYSPLRDLAMEVEAWALTGNGEKATSVARKVANDFSPIYCSTQEVAFVSVAMSRLSDIMSIGNNEIVISGNNIKPIVLRNLRGVKNISLDAHSGSVAVDNKSEGEISVSLLSSRRPAADEIIPATATGVDIKVHYTDLQGKKIAVDKLKQGEEFIAHIEVKKGATASESIALTFAIPSGWEIWNDRLMDSSEERTTVKNIDIRDERISWYFGLRNSEKREFSVRLRAAWCGKYIMPATVCEDMYDARCRAILSNRIVEVVK